MEDVFLHDSKIACVALISQVDWLHICYLLPNLLRSVQ